MINLLPENNKKQLLTEYHYRVIVVALIAVIAVIIIGITLLVPSYVLSSLQQEASRQTIAGANSTNVAEHKKLLDQLNAIKRTLKAIDEPQHMPLAPTVFFTTIVNDKLSAITITSFNYTLGDKSTASIVGHANTREDLQAFAEKLKNDPTFSAVNLPISIFAKDKDLSFTITLTLK